MAAVGFVTRARSWDELWLVGLWLNGIVCVALSIGLVAWLTLDAAERERARVALANEAARLYSWESVAKGVIAAAQGRLAELPRPATPAVGLRAP